MFSFQEITLMLWSFAVLSCWLPRSCPSTICSQQAPLQSPKAPCPPEKGALAPMQRHGPMWPFLLCRLTWSGKDLWLGFQKTHGFPAQHFPTGSLLAGTPLPKHHTHLHTQHLAPITPWPLAPREIPLSVSSFQPYFGLWARSCLLMCTKLSCLQFYILWCN